jgi:hypothetical protein
MEQQQREAGTQAEADAASVALPSDLHQQVVSALKLRPDIPRDFAVANIARKALTEESVP